MGHLLDAPMLEKAQFLFSLAFGEILFLLPRILLSTFIAFLLSIVVLIFLGRKQLFLRKNKIWNLMAKLHYPLWMGLFVIVGGIHGFIDGIGSRAEMILEDVGKPIIEKNTAEIYNELLLNFPVSSDSEKITIRKAVDHFTNNLQYEIKHDNNIEQENQSLEWIKSNFSTWIISHTINIVATKAVNRAEKSLHFSDSDMEFNKQALMDIQFSQADTVISAIIYTALKNKMDSINTGFKVNLLLFFIMIIALFLLEPLFYFLWLKKKKTSTST